MIPPVPVSDETPRMRILRAIRFFDAIIAEELFDAMEVPDEERGAYASAISRSARRGELDRVYVLGKFQYSLPRRRAKARPRTTTVMQPRARRVAGAR